MKARALGDGSIAGGGGVGMTTGFPGALELKVRLKSIDGGEIFNTLRPRQNGRHFVDNISTCIFLMK